MRTFEQRESIRSGVYNGGSRDRRSKRRRSWRQMKQQTARFMRRIGKKMLEDAPQRIPFCGYEY